MILQADDREVRVVQLLFNSHIECVYGRAR